MFNIDFNNEVVKVAPIAGAAGTDVVARLFFGLSLNEWFYVLTMVYVVVQIIGKSLEIRGKHKGGS